MTQAALTKIERAIAHRHRKATLASLLRSCGPGLQLVEHLAHGGDVVYRHACKLGCEGIVSKRLGSRYRSGRSKDWLKFKNPDAPAVIGGGWATKDESL